MSVLLEYQFTVGSLSPLARAFKSAERMAEQSAKNEERIRSRVVARERPRSQKVAIDPQRKALDDLSKYGQTRMRQELAERQRLDKRAHAARVAMIERERREGIAAERARDRVRRATIGGVATSAFRSTVGVGKAILGATGIAGGAIAASRIGPGIDLDRSIRALAVAGRSPGQSQEDFNKSLASIRGVTSATAIRTGAKQEDVVAGMREYVSATGDLTGAVKNIDSFATVAQAAEANVSDVAKAAAYLSKSMGITAEEMPDALAKLYFQGKKGAFELKDLGAAIPQLGSQAATLGMTGIKGMTTLGGLAQIAQQGTGNAAEAQTALANLFNQIVAKSAKIQSGEAFGGHKVQVFEGGDPKKRMNDIRKILADMIGASGGNVQQLLELGEIRGSKVLNPMVNAYKDAGGGEAGKRAVLKMIEDASDAAGTFKDVQADMAETLKSTSAQLEILNTKLTDAVSSKLLPALTELIPKLEPLIPKFGELLEKLAKWTTWLSENPGTGIGLAVTAAIVKDITAANLGPAIGAAISGAIAAARGSIAAGAAAEGLAGLAGNAAAGGGLLAGARGALAGAAGASTGAAIAMTVGSVALAAGTVYAAYDQNDKLKTETGGLGMWDMLSGALSGKGSFFQQANAQLDAQAKAARAAEDAAQAQKDAAVALKAAAGAMQPGAPPTAGASPNRGADPTAARL